MTGSRSHHVSVPLIDGTSCRCWLGALTLIAGGVRERLKSSSSGWSIGGFDRSAASIHVSCLFVNSASFMLLVPLESMPSFCVSGAGHMYSCCFHFGSRVTGTQSQMTAFDVGGTSSAPRFFFSRCRSLLQSISLQPSLCCVSFLDIDCSVVGTCFDPVLVTGPDGSFMTIDFMFWCPSLSSVLFLRPTS